MNTLLGGIERALVPLDITRRALYRLAVPWLGPWIRSREVRIGIHGVTVVLFAWLGALVAPLLLLALGPLLLGVPHLLSDLRYLVVRPGLHRRREAVGLGCLLVLCSVLVDLRIGLFAATLFPLFATTTWPRRLLGMAPLGILFGLSLLQPASTAWGLAHAHNLVAVFLWRVLGTALHTSSKGGHLARWLPTGLFLLGGGSLFSGYPEAWLGLGLPGAPTFSSHLQQLAPGLDPALGERLVITFAFAQAVHYGLWLRVMPEEGRVRPAPRSWKASLAALRADFGDRALTAAILLTGVIALWGTVDLADARAGYLRLALFHGPLELGLVGLVLAEGRSVLRP